MQLSLEEKNKVLYEAFYCTNIIFSCAIGEKGGVC